MVKLTLEVSRSVDENARDYFEKAKKARKKLSGVTDAILETKRQLEAALAEEREKAAAEQHDDSAPRARRTVRRSKRWYDKFRWFISSDGLLCVGGRDASTNELLIKKHTDAGDVVFHTDMAGSPFIVIKAQEAGISFDEVPDSTLDEAAQFTASMSRAWKSGVSAVEVFFVKPEQVSKEAQAGEYLAKGAFMIRGKTTYRRPTLELAACAIERDLEKDSGEKEVRVMVAASSACKAHACEGKTVTIQQGGEKVSDAAKRLKELLPRAEEVPLDEIIQALPPGGVKLKL